MESCSLSPIFVTSMGDVPNFPRDIISLCARYNQRLIFVRFWHQK